MFDVQKIRADFPILSRQVNGRPLVYLDNAASAQKPEAVIEAMAGQARTAYANVHRGLHTLANETAGGDYPGSGGRAVQQYCSETRKSAAPSVHSTARPRG